MRVERAGAALAFAGGGLLVVALIIGWSSLAVGAVALAALGTTTYSLGGSWPAGGRLARLGLGTTAASLVAFSASAVIIDGLHPSTPFVDVALFLIVIAGIVVTAAGSLVIAASAIRAIVGLRPTPADGASERPARVRRIRRGVAGLLAAIVILGLSGYTAYVGTIGSDELAHPSGSTDCRTPKERFGWTYTAINYDIADDSLLQARNPDMEDCSSQGVGAGDQVVTSDGVRIAGWYVPAANGAGPTGPTVVLVHGWGADKSEVLKYAVPLHPTFNVLAFDERDGGRSGRTTSTFAWREQLDVEAVVNWLERTMHPAHLAVMGNSMGGGATVLAAAGDPRIEAVILEFDPCPRFQRPRDAPRGRLRRPSRLAWDAGDHGRVLVADRGRPDAGRPDQRGPCPRPPSTPADLRGGRRQRCARPERCPHGPASPGGGCSSGDAPVPGRDPRQGHRHLPHPMGAVGGRLPRPRLQPAESGSLTRGNSCRPGPATPDVDPAGLCARMCGV